MDRALKERIIGAVVLVAVVVLVVPVFLDGPPSDDELVSERVPLPGQDDAAEVRTQVLLRDRDEPVPASSTPEPQRVAEPVAQSPAPVQTEAQPEEDSSTPEPQPPATEPDSAAESPTGMFAVQLGSFSNQENAEKLAADLRQQGFAAFLSQLSTASGQLHRVRIGPQENREAAEAMAARLASAGHNGQVVPHP